MPLPSQKRSRDSRLMLKKIYFVCLQAENSNVGTSRQAESSNAGTSRRQGDCESGSPSSKRRKVPQAEIFPCFLKQFFFFFNCLYCCFILYLCMHILLENMFLNCKTDVRLFLMQVE